MSDDARPAGQRTYRVPGAILTEREHVVPLDHADPEGPTISVFTREVAAPDGTDRPYLLYLQGGPGFEAVRPTSPPTGWMKRAVRDYRVLLLDQRGTGRSTPLGSEIPGDSPEAQAEYLTHFRADAIVHDAERIRAELGVGAMERPRPELRRVHHDDLPVDRARWPGRGDAHRRAGPHRSPGRRHLRGDVPAADQGQSAVFRTLPGRSRRGSATSDGGSMARTSACRPATG